MMQQLATQRSDIAALPIDIESKSTADVASGNNQQFADTYKQVTSAKPPERARNADDVTDAKTLKDVDKRSKRAEEGSQREDATDDTAATRGERSSDAAKAVDQNASENRPKEKKSPDELQQEDVAVQQEASAEAESSDVDDSTDWLAYVDAIRAHAKGEGSEESVSLKVDESGDITIETDDEALLLEDQAAAKFAAIIASLKGEQQTDGAEVKEISPEDAVKEMAEALNEAITAMLESKGDEESSEAESTVNEEEVMKLAASLVASLMKTSAKDGAGKADEVNSTEAADAQAIADDSALLVDLLKAELGGDASGSETDNSSAGQPDTDKSEVPADTSDIIHILADAEPQTQQLAKDAIADKVVALLPDSVSESQKNDIKVKITDAIDQFQKQLAAGSEEHASVEAAIADVLTDAGLQSTEGLEQAIASEVRQVGLLASAAQQIAMGQTPDVAHHNAKADFALNDIQQMKAERASQPLNQDADKAVNIHQPEGQQQLAEKVRWMVNARNSMAEIRLDPPELGSMQVRVNVSGDSASVNFIVQSPQARDALAQAEPRLREMLAEQGINLGESFVSQQQQGNGETGEHGQSSGSGHGSEFADGGDEDMQVTEQQLTRRAQGGIDDYA